MPSQIRKAYRTKSLLYHPDKNPSPSAVQNFHYLNLALELLLSPAARSAYDNVRKARAAKAERTAKYDGERQRMQRELETRERDAKRRRVDGMVAGGQGDTEEGDLRAAVERLKEESERLKRERDRRMKEELDRMQQSEEEDDETLRTVRVRFHKGPHRSSVSGQMLHSLFSEYGVVENVILGKSALVVFESVAGAKAALAIKKDKFDFIKEVTMVDSLPPENTRPNEPPPATTTQPDKIPDIFTQKQPSEANTNSAPAAAQGPPKPRFSFKPTAPTTESNGTDYESITLLRMRKLEREKLEREIRESEDKADTDVIPIIQ